MCLKEYIHNVFLLKSILVEGALIGNQSTADIFNTNKPSSAYFLKAADASGSVSMHTARCCKQADPFLVCFHLHRGGIPMKNSVKCCGRAGSCCHFTILFLSCLLWVHCFVSSGIDDKVGLAPVLCAGTSEVSGCQWKNTKVTRWGGRLLKRREERGD